MVTRFAAVAVTVLAVASCGGNDSNKSATKTTAAPSESLTITSPVDGAVIKGNVVKLDVDTRGVTLVKADGDTSGKTGHLHVFIDRDPPAAGAVIPKEAGIVHSAINPVVLSGLHVGTHRLVVVYGDGAHARIGSAKDEVTVKVEGPSVDATAPATSPAGQPVVVTVAVEGFTLAKADGDTSGATGHVHLFVDRDPTAAGQAIPKEDGIIHSADTSISIPDLAPGEHTIWVVVGNGVHVPFEPSVTDKVVVTVT